MPASVEVAVEVFGSKLRVALLRVLAEVGPQTVPDLAERLEVRSRVTVIENLDVLERLMVVRGDPAPGARRGRRDVTYSVNRAQLDLVTEALRAYLDPQPGSDSPDTPGAGTNSGGQQTDAP